MDIEKKEALVKWIEVMVHDVEIATLSEIKENSTILLQLLSKIDIDLQCPINTNEKNIAWVCQYLKEMFNTDVLDENQVQLGNEVEIGKMLCLILELTLTSKTNSDYISKIQLLSEHVQTNIMSMTKMVCDHSQKFNLGNIMDRKLRMSVTDEDDSNTIDESRNTPPIEVNIKVGQASTPVNASPHLNQLSLNGSLGDNSSPLAAFASSPQAFCHRVMIENKKLKQKVRHSELFSRRKEEFEEQMSQDLESEKKVNEKLLKEQDQLLQRMKDHEDTIIKLKEEIEFLQLESQTKDKEVYDNIEEIKKSKELLSEMQNVVDKCSALEAENKQKQSSLNNESQKCAGLKLENSELKDELEQQKICIENERKQHQTAKQTFEDREKEIVQVKKDYLDQLADLQEKLAKQQKQSITAANAETLSDALQNDTELLNWKEKCKKLQNEVNVQESTLRNMGKQQEAENQRFQTDIENSKNELKNVTRRYDESTKNYKKQSNQYMDQISTLLKQVEELSKRNEGLNDKMTSAEGKCRLLEKQLEKYEDSQGKINAANAEMLSDALQNDTELVNWKEKCKKLQNEVNVQESTLRNMGEQQEAENQRFQTDIENYKSELKNVTQSNDESTKNYKKESNQYMDQISTLLKQIAALQSTLKLYTEENEKLKAVEKEFLALSMKHEALKIIETKYDETRKENVSLKSIELQYEQAVTEIKMLKTKKQEEEAGSFETMEIVNEYMNELKTKQCMIEQLEVKVLHAQMDQKHLTTTIRSLEAQLKSSEEVIRNLKKDLKVSQSASSLSSTRTSNRIEEPKLAAAREASTASESSDEETSCALQLGHLEDESKKIENKAEEIFQRSRSTRSKLRRSLLVVPSSLQEESETSDEKEQFSRAYSLRSKSDRRRSFQPRRYMGGNTPPNRRTLIGDPMQVQMCTFNTDTAEEPEVDYDWCRIQTLSESEPERDVMNEHRLKELQRRNNLCLPHLRSAYPMELCVDKEKNVSEKVIRYPNAGSKRKVEEEGPRGTYKKWKTESTLGHAGDLSHIGRSTRSDSNLRREVNKIDQPISNAQSCAFEISIEAPSKSRPRLARSLASGNLRTKTENMVTKTELKKRTVENSTNVSTKKNNRQIKRSSAREVLNPESGSRFNRGDGVRNSFKSARQKVAASLRGKKLMKK